MAHLAGVRDQRVRLAVDDAGPARDGAALPQHELAAGVAERLVAVVPDVAQVLRAQLGGQYQDIGVNTMRDAVRNRERWKRRRTPTQDPSTYREGVGAVDEEVPREAGDRLVVVAAKALRLGVDLDGGILA